MNFETCRAVATTFFDGVPSMRSAIIRVSSSTSLSLPFSRIPQCRR
jgi:hypothetical protein